MTQIGRIPAAPGAPPARHQRAIGGWITLLLLLIYLLGYSGLLHAVDELSSLAMLESFLANGETHVNAMAWEQQWQPSQNEFGRDGALYSKKGLAVPLLVLPLFALGKALAAPGAVQLSLLLVPFLTAATARLVYACARRLGYTTAVAGLATLAWGLGTLAWPYARTLFSEPVAAFGVALALYGAICFRRAPGAGLRPALLAGAGAGLLVLAKQANAVAVVPLALYLIAAVASPAADPTTKKPRAGGARALLDRGLLPALIFALPLLAAVALLVLRSWLHFGLLFGFPLDPIEGFTTPLHIGLAGQLVSPGKGLLWYMPLLWIMPLGLLSARHPQGVRREMLLAAGIVLGLLLLYATWWDWAGGTAWGPRMIVPATPALVLLCLPAMAWLWRGGRRARWLLIGVLAISTLAQLPGVLINTAVQEGYETYLGVDDGARYWTWMWSPIRTHWRTLLTEFITEPLLLQPFVLQADLPLVAALLGLALLGVGMALYGMNRGPQWALRDRRAGQIAALLCAGGLALGLVLAAAGDPRWHERGAEPEDNQAIWAFLRQEGRSGDRLVLDMLPYYDLLGRTSTWMNSAPLHPAPIGWLRGQSRLDPGYGRLQGWLIDADRIWLSLAMTPLHAPDSITETWLDTWAYRSELHWFGTQRLVLYYTPGSRLLARGSENVPFGADPQEPALLLTGYRVTASADGHAHLIDLAWATETAPDPALRFSAQLLDAEGRLLRQIDAAPGGRRGEGDTMRNRLALEAAPGGRRLILKAYRSDTGAPLAVFLPPTTERSGDYLLLYHEAGADDD